MVFNVKTEDKFDLVNRVRCFSDWHRAKRGIAVIVRLQQRVKIKSKTRANASTAETSNKLMVDVEVFHRTELEII